MILYRYLAKEGLFTSLAVIFILLLIFLSNKFVRILGAAAQGDVAGHAVLQLISTEIPALLTLLLPLGLFLGLLIAFGRLYADNEMTVMFGGGFSRLQLFKASMLFMVPFVLLSGCLSFWGVPKSLAYKEALLADSSNSSALATMLPGRFQVSDDGRRVYYVESMSRDRKKMNNIFLAELEGPKTKEKKAKEDEHSYWTVSSANQGYAYVNTSTKQPFFVTVNGHRYKGIPGQQNFEITDYRTYAFEVEQKQGMQTLDQEAMPTSLLWKKRKMYLDAAELQWRVSVPISILLLVCLVVPLSHIDPRQGKFARLLLGIVIYIFYANLISIGRAFIIRQKIPPYPGMTFVHILMLLTVVFCWWRYSRKTG